ncbi:MAG TPA: HIT domain-containing protein [Bacteroidota bacterium]|jgi:ATP adenylyltransferase|nr:HIT domain-containing protein [Bacteroidota bacterium]
MERLFSPWRSKYIQTFSQPGNNKEDCVFCKAHQANDDDLHLIVTRGKTCFVIMNLYPYNSGHLMVVPFRHTPSIIDLGDEESLEMITQIKKMMKALQEVSRPDGFNVGSNVGRTAGAGIDQHVHFHIVPRWNGDSNFMPVLADTKIISEDMQATLSKLRKAL